jgi:hypothetical protein
LDPSRRRLQGEHGRCLSKTDKLKFTSNVFRIWRDFPDMRLGQLIDNARTCAAEANSSPPDVFYVEDDALHEALYSYWLQYSTPGRRILDRREAADEKRHAGS